MLVFAQTYPNYILYNAVHISNQSQSNQRKLCWPLIQTSLLKHTLLKRLIIMLHPSYCDPSAAAGTPKARVKRRPETSLTP